MGNKLEGVSKETVEALVDIGAKAIATPWKTEYGDASKTYARRCITTLLASGEVITKAEHDAEMKKLVEVLIHLGESTTDEYLLMHIAAAVEPFTTNHATTGETE